MKISVQLPGIRWGRAARKPAIVVVFIFFGVYNGFCQSISMSGRIVDDTLNKGVKNAVAMAVRLSDSVLVKFSRSDSTGFFRMENLPIDTYQVVFSHPKFGDRTFIIMVNKADSAIDFKNVALPIRSALIAEVIIYGFASPVYFKGDTLIYAADSFKVKPNAVVEDLLKKLPGMRVDNSGKIYSNGEQVDKVLVDGDEFFGADPTVATKNLPANSVESVQVYDKKNENATEDSKETEKVMNLKLKEDAKKGFFGKVTGASDFNRFFEGQLLLNKFRGKQKISIFSLGSNTLSSQFNWRDVDEYGLHGEYNFEYSEEEDMGFQYSRKASPGIPQTFKNGLYFSDKLFKETNLSIDYTNIISDLKIKRDINSQYLFSDTSYQTHEISTEEKHSENNTANIRITQKLDSQTTLTLSSKIKYDSGKRNFAESKQFLSNDNEVQHETTIDNSTTSRKYDVKSNLWLIHEFKKKNRKLTLNYRYSINSGRSNGFVRSASYSDSLPLTSEIDQEKISETEGREHMAATVYTEPLSPKIKAELAYDYTGNEGRQEKQAFDFFNGDYEQFNDSLTNGFENSRQINRAGLKFIYETKKRTFSAGVRLRQVGAQNINTETQQKLAQTVNSVLPYAKFRYTLSDNARLGFGYTTTSKLPDLNQLHPIADNSDPNSVYIGNAGLLPSYSQTFNLNYNFFKAVKGNSMWSTLKFTTIDNNISNSVYYDSAGKSITQPVNVDGNYRGNFNFYYSRPFFNKKLEIGPDINSVYSNSSNIINGEANSTQNISLSAGFYAAIHADSGAMEITLEGKYGKSFSKATISNFTNGTFVNGSYTASVLYELTKKWTIATDITYTYQNRQAGTSNVEFYAWGAALSKKFLKQETLVLSIEAFDLLDQNLEAEQTIEDNVITYSKSNTVGRYILLKAVYKFAGNKKSGDEE